MLAIHQGLSRLIRSSSPDCVVVENLFHARNVRSALTLGHARGVAVLAAVEAGLPVLEYTPADVKQAVVGYGRAEKRQIQHMVALLLGLETAPSPHDAADALAVAICHAHDGRWRPGGRRPACPGRAELAAHATRPDRQAPHPVIARLSGTLLEKHVQRLVVDVGGVGYEVLVPLSTSYAVGEPGGAVALRIHMHVREDALQLFGFATPLEQTLFERLIAVNGVGPRLALAVLSGIESRDLVTAVRQGDLARLTRIPGVGRRTAERLVVELRDRLPADEAAATQAPGAGGVRDDVLSALLNLGYQRSAVEKTIDAVLRRGDLHEFEPLLREILRELSRA